MRSNQINLQIDTIDQVITILKKYPSVIAAGLRGSHANNSHTPFSDIDLIVVFDTDERRNLKEIFTEIAGIKPTLSTLYQLYDKESLILFEDGVRLDIAFNKPSEFQAWVLTDIKILFDPQDVIKNLLKQTKGNRHNADKPKWSDNEGVFIDWFFWMFRQSYCYVLQSTKLPVKSFEKLDLAIDSIKSIRNKLIETVYYLNGSRDYLENIDPKLKQLFIKTYPSYDVKSCLESIRKLVDIYEIIIKEYCLKEGIKFPADKVVAIRKLFLEFDSYL